MSTQEDLVRSVVGVTRLQPGDRVLVRISSDVSREHALAMKALLDERFPDVEFTVLAGADVLVVPGGF